MNINHLLTSVSNLTNRSTLRTTSLFAIRSSLPRGRRNPNTERIPTHKATTHTSLTPPSITSLLSSVGTLPWSVLHPLDLYTDRPIWSSWSIKFRGQISAWTDEVLYRRKSPYCQKTDRGIDLYRETVVLEPVHPKIYRIKGVRVVSTSVFCLSYEYQVPIDTYTTTIILQRS